MEEDYDDGFDWAFEQFAEDTGFLTNFSEWQLPQYQRAVVLGKEKFPEIEMQIGDGWKNPHALYFLSERKDLSGWWKMFDTCEQGD